MKSVGFAQTRVKMFASKTTRDLEREVNDWLSTNTFDEVEFQYNSDFSFWSCLVVYKLPQKDDASE